MRPGGSILDGTWVNFHSVGPTAGRNEHTSRPCESRRSRAQLSARTADPLKCARRPADHRHVLLRLGRCNSRKFDGEAEDKDGAPAEASGQAYRRDNDFPPFENDHLAILW